MNISKLIDNQIVEFDEKKQDLKDWLYGTVYKGYDLEELSEVVQSDVDDFFTKDWHKSSTKALLEAVIEMVEVMKKTYNPGDYEILYIDPMAVEGYNQALTDILKELQ